MQALTFFECTNLVVNNLKIKNGQQIQMSFEKCNNVEASNLVVNAPGNSPNTDGIHITETQNIQISSSTIGTGIFQFDFSVPLFVFCWIFNV